MKQWMLFIAGLGMGAAGCWIGVKKYYENLANEEIASVKEYYGRTREYREGGNGDEGTEGISGDEMKTNQKENYRDYAPDGENVINYHDFYKKEEMSEEEPEEQLEEPYVISTDDFATDDMYEKTTLNYFKSKDGSFCRDEDGDVVLNVEDLVGANNLATFGEDGETVMYVRNEELETDYEVALMYYDTNFEEGDYEEY